MTEVYLALGGNVGDVVAHIDRAIELLSTKLQNIQRAPLYRSRAVGFVNQPDFINTAISAQTDLEPQALLTFAKQVEQQVGRTVSFHWGPREIDIDIIFYDDQKITSDRLTIPHPLLAERDFVLQPITDLDPSLIDPVTGKRVSVLLSLLTNSQKTITNKV